MADELVRADGGAAEQLIEIDGQIQLGIDVRWQALALQYAQLEAAALVRLVRVISCYYRDDLACDDLLPPVIVRAGSQGRPHVQTEEGGEATGWVCAWGVV